MHKESIKELSEKYGLHEEIVKEEVELVVSILLTTEFGFEVSAQFKEDSTLSITGYPSVNGITTEVKINPKKLKKSLVNLIGQGITQALQSRVAICDCGMMGSYISKVMYGEVYRVMPYGDVYVYLQDVPKDFLAVCKTEFQTPKERGKLKCGDILPFHVSPSIEVGDDGVEIRLIRTSRKLTEGLLERELYNRFLDLEVRCVKRIVGMYNVVKTWGIIPNEVVNAVSGELEETVYVRLF